LLLLALFIAWQARTHGFSTRRHANS